MKSWSSYKEYVKSVDEERKKDIQENEELAVLISAMIQQRKNLGLSQRDLANLCNMPQSTVARIESYKITPNLETFLKILKTLGLQLSVNVVE